MPTCSVETCDRVHFGRGYCQGHYARLKRTGDVAAATPLGVKHALPDECTIAECDGTPHARGMCITHYSRARRGAVIDAPVTPKGIHATCTAQGCSRPHWARGLCRLHDRRMRTFGSLDLPDRTPEQCALSTCTRMVRANGYCNSHAERLRLTGSVDETRPLRAFRATCELDGCDRAHYSFGYCVNHYQQRITKPRRRALEGAAVGEVTAEQLQARVDYYGGRCWMCGDPWTCIDHVKPLSVGGSNWPANLRPACTSCNASKHNRWPLTELRKAA